VSQACNRDNFAIGRSNYDWRYTGKIHFVWMQDGERHAGTATGIDRVSACVQYCIAGFSSEIVTGGHSMTVAVERWPHVKSPARLSRIYSSLSYFA
jgi:hypothetical protein